jgi:hypothetical protein
MFGLTFIFLNNNYLCSAFIHFPLCLFFYIYIFSYGFGDVDTKYLDVLDFELTSNLQLFLFFDVCFVYFQFLLYLNTAELTYDKVNI